MNRRKRLMLTPLAFAAVVAWGIGDAAQPSNTGQPYGTAKPANPGNGRGHWDEHFQGLGNVTNTRCQGMSRGANCITPALRKDAARRAAAARAAADGAGTAGGGGN